MTGARGRTIDSDKASLDIFWLRDESLEESDNLPDPDILAQEIVEDLEAVLEQFREIAADLGSKKANRRRGMDYRYAFSAGVSRSKEGVWQESLKMPENSFRIEMNGVKVC